MASLIVWMNGERVGEWGTLRGGRTPFFRYAESWVRSPHGRAVSLSLPITADLEIRGSAVEYYFDNLLPDSSAIRGRIRSRFRARSADTFDLLSAIGRDCIGAVQLLPPNEEPVGWDRIHAQALTDEEVAQALREVTLTTPFGHSEQKGFPISLSGDQEKTALLHMAGRWYRPRGATPTTHILKLPLGGVGGFHGDFSDSVENEWLCAQLLRELGLPVAQVAIGRFAEQRALIVSRFDRRWIGVDAAEIHTPRFKPRRGMWIARLPQDDFCQALGLPNTLRYEADGGPSALVGLQLLATSEAPHVDQTHFALAQLAFWLLAATDGHAKNFSLYYGPGARYRMTPLYNVISAWPIIDHGKSQLALEKAELAMAVHGRRARYRMSEITSHDWQAFAEDTGTPELWARMQSLVGSAPAACERVGTTLPRAFPERVYTTIREGVLGQVRRFGAAISAG